MISSQFSSALNEPDTALAILDKALSMQLDLGNAHMSAASVTSDLSISSSTSRGARCSGDKISATNNIHHNLSDPSNQLFDDNIFVMDENIKVEDHNDVLMMDNTNLNIASSNSSNNITTSISNSNSVDNISNNSSNNYLPSFLGNDEFSCPTTSALLCSSVPYPDCSMDSSTISYRHTHDHLTADPSQLGDSYDPFKCLESIAEQSLTGNFTTISSSSSLSVPFPSSMASSSTSSSCPPSLSSIRTSSSPSTSQMCLPSSARGAPSHDLMALNSQSSRVERCPRGGNSLESHSPSDLPSNVNSFPTHAGNPLAGQMRDFFSCPRQGSGFDHSFMSRDPDCRSRGRDMISSDSISSSIPKSSASSPSSSPAASLCMYSNNNIPINTTEYKLKSQHHKAGSSHCKTSPQSSNQRETIKVESPFNQSPPDCQNYSSLSCTFNNIGGRGGGRSVDAGGAVGAAIPNQGSAFDLEGQYVTNFQLI